MVAETPASPDPQGFFQPLVGLVVAIQANYYQVKLDQPQSRAASQPSTGSFQSGREPEIAVEKALSSNHDELNTFPDSLSSTSFSSASSASNRLLLCTRRARLKKIGQQVMVGNRVLIEEPDWQGNRGAIAEVLPRSSELDRPPVANANQILLVFALTEPTLDPHQLSHFLVKAESTGLKVLLCLSKADLVSNEVQQQWGDRLQQWGYQPIFISVHQAIGLQAIASALQGKMTIVSGPSGVGKSSLINHLIPQAGLRVGAVSGKLGRGRHTTRHVELFDLTSGGLLADTPGFNQPELTCSPKHLANCFPEIRQRLALASCQFSNCLHRDEPGCAVQGNWERYDDYLEFLEEAIARQQIQDRSSDPEASLKRKTKHQGQQHYEPKLTPHKYRRPSRQSQQQVLLNLSEEFEEI